LAQGGVDTTLFVHSPEHDMPEPSGTRFVKGRGGGLKTVWEDTAWMMDEGKPDIIHLHGLWMPSNHIVARLARRKKVPYVISPRGMLEPWSLNAKKWKKRLAMWLYQRRDLEAAVALHATAESEAEQFRRLGFNQPVIVAPNGVDIPADMPPRTRQADARRTALFLSRIHPKKGLMELVEVWARMKSQQSAVGSRQLSSGRTVISKWHFEYAGPGCDGHLAAVQRRMKGLGVEEDFTYLGDLDDRQKWQAYRRADLFVLPTYSENFGIVVAEALAAGMPVITTKGAPWSELVAERCGWWIDIGAEPLAEALREAMGLTDEERRIMGENGQRLVAAKYTWPAIAEQMKQAYEWVLNGGEPPSCVRC
jgi:glycosyltransferase involved in cell wall biosynthesis